MRGVVVAGAMTLLCVCVTVSSVGGSDSHNDLRAHVGLGAADRIERLEIRWPSGLTETMNGLPVDRFYVAHEGKGVTPAPKGTGRASPAVKP